MYNDERRIFRVAQLIDRQIHGGLSAAEERELEQWIQENYRHRALFQRLQEPLFRREALSRMGKYREEQILERILSGASETSHRRSASRRATFLRAAVAAGILFLMTLGVYVYFHQSTPPDTKTVASDIEPGGHRATLSLPDGTVYSLDQMQVGQLAQQNNLEIIKESGGKLVYKVLGGRNKDVSAGEHTIRTPWGGQYNVILPDGSAVWLNAGSSLVYPSHFSGTERRVRLKGEAYFEVSERHDQPFVVVSANQEVEVLGTHFNVKAYEEDESTTTTLLEGRVQVRMQRSSQEPQTVVLQAGQQAVVDDSTLQVFDSGLTEIDWVNGYFLFSDERLETLLQAVARWYDVEIVYEDSAVKDRVFSGSVSRFENVSQLLSILELTGLVHFKIDERRIIVMK